MTQSNGPLCLLISRPDVEGYPPVLNQALILKENAFNVSIADEGKNIDAIKLPDASTVERQHVGGRSGGTFFQRIRNGISFHREVKELIKKRRPKVVIAYDEEACYAAGAVARSYGAKLIWHFHEMPEPKATSIAIKLASRFVNKHSDLPSLIVFPDEQRADLFSSMTGFGRRKISIVMNCTRLLPEVPVFKIADVLPDRISPADRIIVYNGSVGPNHGLETAVCSMPQWPQNTVFLIKGRAHPDYDTRLGALAAKHGVMERVVRIGYSPGFEFYAGAHIGWTVNEHWTENMKFSAGASNKRFDCMAVGFPQITDNAEGTKKMIESANCGICIPPDAVEAAAKAVNYLLGDEDRRRQMGVSGRKAHLRGWNYEAQFAPVLKKILG